MVSFKNRAWHAGKSYWKGETDINSNSIGIEIDNSGKLLDFENYNNFQILSLIKLLKFIKKKYNISFHNILGHSDIAPYRKIDPGEKFPWKKLSTHGIGRWYKEKKNFSKKNIKKMEFLFFKNLQKLGFRYFSINRRKNDDREVIKSFQLHYLPNNTSGKIDKKTFKISHFLTYKS